MPIVTCIVGLYQPFSMKSIILLIDSDKKVINQLNCETINFMSEVIKVADEYGCKNLELFGGPRAILKELLLPYAGQGYNIRLEGDNV